MENIFFIGQVLFKQISFKSYYFCICSSMKSIFKATELTFEAFEAMFEAFEATFESFERKTQQAAARK